MQLVDVYIQRGTTKIVFNHTDYNKILVRVLESEDEKFRGLICTITRPKAGQFDPLLPQALYMDACLKAAQFLELEVMGAKERLEESVLMQMNDTDVLRIFPLYHKAEQAWGADGHVYITEDGNVSVFSLPIPHGHTWQDTVSSVLMTPILKMTINQFISYETITSYYHSEQAVFDINNEIQPLSAKKIEHFEDRADAFAKLLRKA